MLRFVAVSVAVHLLVLAPWPAPRLADYRSDVVLSVGLTTLDRKNVLTKVSTAAIPQDSRLVGTNTNRSDPQPAHDSKRDSTHGAPTPITTVVINETRRRSEDIGVGPFVMETALPIALSEPSKAATYTGTQHQRPPVDTPIAMSSPFKFEEPVATANMTAHGETKSASAQIRGKLQTDLARYFSYPAIARQRGWQGHVRIGFRIESDGKLSNIYIARSSGYRLLDTSALKALRRVEPLADAATLLKGKTVDMELPVIYRLEQP
jgi:TonB family protein